MIRINKFTFSIPRILINEGTAKASEHIRDFNNNPIGFQLRGQARAKFNFDNSIYGNEEVKSRLKDIQYHKCCFCEAKITHISHGDIEHFRPKAAYVQDVGSIIVYPGYFWLAYDWYNLFFACEKCNGRPNKGNFFPLLDETQRSCFNQRNIDNEEPLFIDPGIDDPEAHISFMGPDPVVINDSLKGKNTIEHLGLDREELVEHRRSKYNILKSLESIVKITQDSINAEEAKDIFNINYRMSCSIESEYSSMVRSNFSEL